MSHPTPAILVVEDDEAIREGIVDALRYAGYRPLEAADGEAGLEMALRVDCDLILLDLVLPKHDGFEILEAVRRERSGLPVIILTARGEEGDRVRGLRGGADDYVVKPFSVEGVASPAWRPCLRRSARSDPSDVLDDCAARTATASTFARSGDSIRTTASATELSETRSRTLLRLPRVARQYGTRDRPRRNTGPGSGRCSPDGVTHAHDRHARRAPAREAARRPGRAAGDRHRARQGLHAGGIASPMTRPWTARAAFALGLAIAIAGMSWLTVVALGVERSEREARARELRDETVRSALWRMDSAISPFIANEGARPYFLYSAFYPAERAYDRMFGELSRGEVLIPSPLLTESAPFVRLYFQVAPDGAVGSPQVPDSNMRDLAESGYVAPKAMGERERELDRLRASLDCVAVRVRLARRPRPGRPAAAEGGCARSCRAAARGRPGRAPSAPRRRASRARGRARRPAGCRAGAGASGRGRPPRRAFGGARSSRARRTRPRGRPSRPRGSSPSGRAGPARRGCARPGRRSSAARPRRARGHARGPGRRRRARVDRTRAPGRRWPGCGESRDRRSARRSPGRRGRAAPAARSRSAGRSSARKRKKGRSDAPHAESSSSAASVTRVELTSR